MNGEENQYEITIKDKNLFKRLTSFAQATGRSMGDVTEEALHEYFANIDSDSSDDEVFNPDPGA